MGSVIRNGASVNTIPGDTINEHIGKDTLGKYARLIGTPERKAGCRIVTE